MASICNGIIHSGEKPYKCVHCEKRFKTAGDLQGHFRIHSDERPYNCTQCDKSFSTRKKLNNHVQIHSDETLQMYSVWKML